MTAARPQTRWNRRGIPGLIDVHVTTGPSNDSLLRSARKIGADLIVVGRRDGGTACLSQLREMLRDSRVMCAVAIDDRDRHVFAHALALARRHDAKLLVVHAASPDIAFNRGATERVDFLRTLRLMAEEAGVDVRVTVQQGPVRPRSSSCTRAHDMRT